MADELVLTTAQQIYVSALRQMLSDDDPLKNILNGQQQAYSDAKLLFFLDMALSDINGTSPITSFSYDNFPLRSKTLLVTGAMIQAYIAEGVLQLRNQIDYSDAGLSVGLFNKTGGYQGWAGFLLQSYASMKQDFKRGVLANTGGAGFVGIASGFHVDFGRY